MSNVKVATVDTLFGEVNKYVPVKTKLNKGEILKDGVLIITPRIRKVKEDTGHYDFFLHDSEHTYEVKKLAEGGFEIKGAGIGNFITGSLTKVRNVVKLLAQELNDNENYKH